MHTRKGEVMANQYQERVSQISEVVPDEIDLQMIEEFEEENVEESIEWENYKTKREERIFNGNISLRVPKDLHRELVEMAKAQGVSLNQYCLYKLAR